jgi:hypothetical protein
MNTKAFFLSIFSVLILSIVFSYFLIFGANSFFEKNISVAFKLSENVFLDIPSLADDKIVFESDVDLLLVLKDSSSNSGDEKNTKLITLISRFLIKSGYLFSVVVKDESELSEQKYGLLQNIEQEGITL